MYDPCEPVHDSHMRHRAPNGATSRHRPGRGGPAAPRARACPSSCWPWSSVSSPGAGWS